MNALFGPDSIDLSLVIIIVHNGSLPYLCKVFVNSRKRHIASRESSSALAVPTG
jgi:hypothetical protein